MDCYCDYDAPEFCSTRMVVARKSRRCEECRRAIAPGERYERTAGKWDGEFSTFDTCAICLSFRAYVIEHVKCFCWAYGSLHADGIETLREYAHELPGMLFGGWRLVVAARRQRAA